MWGGREGAGTTTANVNTGRGDGVDEQKSKSDLLWKNIINFTPTTPKGAALVCGSQRRSGEEARRPSSDVQPYSSLTHAVHPSTSPLFLPDESNLIIISGSRGAKK